VAAAGGGGLAGVVLTGLAGGAAGAADSTAFTDGSCGRSAPSTGGETGLGTASGGTSFRGAGASASPPCSGNSSA